MTLHGTPPLHLLHEESSDASAPPRYVHCPQGPSIKQMSEELREAVTRMEQRDTMIIEALEKVADQGARIDGLRAANEHLAQDLDNLFERVRQIEAAIGKEGGTIDLVVQKAVSKDLKPVLDFVAMATSKPAMGVVGMLTGLVLVGALFDLTDHSEWVRALVGWYLGK